MVEERRRASHTFLGGRMAMADLGVSERWCWWDEALSPLSERRIAYTVNIKLF